MIFLVYIYIFFYYVFLTFIIDDAAKEALTDMPPRSEEELDAVTLHNQALINMDTKPSEGFEKLQFLLQQNPFPPETFANLLLLYCKYQYYDLAADVLAENVHLTYKYLTPVSLIFIIYNLFIKHCVSIVLFKRSYTI